MNLGETYDLMLYIINKVAGGRLSTAEFERILNMGQDILFMERFGNPAEYQPGAPIPRQGYEITQKISDDLRPFKKPIWLQVDREGMALFPDDYVHISSIRKRYVIENKCADGTKPATREVKVRIIDDDKLANVLSSRIVNPTYKNPVCAFYDTHIQFHPVNIQTVRFTYLRRPARVVFAVTQTNNRPVYNPSTSTELEWRPIVHNEIMVRALAQVGINLREPMLQQYAAQKQAEGV